MPFLVRFSITIQQTGTKVFSPFSSLLVLFDFVIDDLCQLFAAADAGLKKKNV